MEQKILYIKDSYKDVDDFLLELGVKNVFLVCGKSIDLLPIGTYFNTLESRLGIQIKRFSDFSPNPSYDSVIKGVKAFHEGKCDIVVAVGGGSAMDLAKCIKLYSNEKIGSDYINQKIVPNNLPFMAVPTTAGTGSETTRYSIIYYQGVKQTITDYSSIPQAVVMDASTLDSLPMYHRKATMMDALCHAIESFWSVNSTLQSKQYAKKAIEMVIKNKDEYLKNSSLGNSAMLQAAYIAGQAINITQTTAGHALSYKLTSMYGLAHGHAVALCVGEIWPYMLKNINLCSDSRGEQYLKNVFDDIASAMGLSKACEAVDLYRKILSSLSLDVPKASEGDIEELVSSVNIDRLKNHPISLDVNALRDIYLSILKV